MYKCIFFPYSKKKKKKIAIYPIARSVVLS